MARLRETTRLAIEDMGAEILAESGRRGFLPDDGGEALAKAIGDSARDAVLARATHLSAHQIGGLYEGLANHEAQIIRDDSVALAQSGDAARGIWLVPPSEAGDYPDSARIGTYCAGDFAFLAVPGSRRSSASFYTPANMVEFAVRHAIEELVNPKGRAPLTSAEIADIRVCEPAMGVGTFLLEAADQLASRYLKARKAEGASASAETYPGLPKPSARGAHATARAWFIENRCFGVDLDAGAVRVASDRLPGARLRQGNALLGARINLIDLANFDASGRFPQTTIRVDLPPEARPTSGRQVAEFHGVLGSKDEWLADGDVASSNPAPVSPDPGERRLVYEFLMPAHFWGASAESATARELHPNASRFMRRWRTAIHKEASSKQYAPALFSLHSRIARRLAMAVGPTIESVSETGLNPGRAHDDLGLKATLDAWCAMASWPLEKARLLPSFGDWIAGLNALLDDAEAAISEIPWLAIAEDIALRESFFHWHLEFPDVFARGGFELQVGNPPWVRPDWKEETYLSRFDAHLALNPRMSGAEAARRRREILADPQKRAQFSEALESASGIAALVGSAQRFPALAGLRPNLYLNFVAHTWSAMAPNGVVGLIHPEAHFLDPNAGRLREATYRRLRRHFHFVNAAGLFADASTQLYFGVHIYSSPGEVDFIQASNIQLPETVDKSVDGDPAAELPSIQFAKGGWDRRPHPHRLVRVDEEVLKVWSALEGEGEPPAQARLILPLTREHQELLATLARVDVRAADLGLEVATGWNEKTSRARGLIVWETGPVYRPGDAILQGPMFYVSQPLYKTPRIPCKSHADYDKWDLTQISDNAVPTTNYRHPKGMRDEAWDTLEVFGGAPAVSYWRLAVRSMTQPGLERSLVPALIPPGVGHINSVHTTVVRTPARLAAEAGIADDAATPVRIEGDPTAVDLLPLSADPQNALGTVLLTGLWSSLACDYLVKVSGQMNLHKKALSRLPGLIDHPAWRWLLARTLRLNCVTDSFGELWDALAPLTDPDDAWTPAFAGLGSFAAPLGDRWSSGSPLRTEQSRRAALVEIDALAAIIFGMRGDQMELAYSSQFPVLRKYENGYLFDADGRLLGAEPHSRGPGQEKDDYAKIRAGQSTQYRPPFTRPDRVAEGYAAHKEFTARLERMGYPQGKS